VELSFTADCADLHDNLPDSQIHQTICSGGGGVSQKPSILGEQLLVQEIAVKYPIKSLITVS
jgi:hypothetical protein